MWRWVKFSNKVKRNCNTILICINGDKHRCSVISFFLNIFYKLIFACIFNTFPNLTVSMEIINTSNNFTFNRVFLVLRNNRIGFSLTVFKRTHGNIKTSVSKHIKICFKSVFWKACHRYSFISAYCS